jgi:hypothetical protein
MYYLALFVPLWFLGCATSAIGGAHARLEASSSAQSSSTVATTLDVLPLPKQSLKIAAATESETSLFQLVSEFERICDVHFLISQANRSILEKSPVGLIGKLEAAPADAWATFETMLVQAGFVLTLADPISSKLVRIESTQGPLRNQLRDGAVLIDVADLPTWAARHPAFLVTCVIEVQNSDARQLSNSLRGMMTDSTTQQVLPVGNSNTLIATGFAPQVHSLATTIARIDAIAARAPLERAVPAKAAAEPEKQPK